MPISIAHIINPVSANPTSDLYKVQPITFETIRIAKEYSCNRVDVQLITTQYEEDKAIIPSFFLVTDNLKRSVLDISSFTLLRKLPLIADVLEKLYENSEAEYLIYTNVDIAVMPFFYDTVADIISQGYDAFVINRRRVNSSYTSIDDLPKLFADIGRPHPGFDCFVFHRSLYPKFKLGNICLGVPFIEASMAYNLIAFANKFKVFDNLHATVHIGLEVMPNRQKEYYWHNRNEFNKIKKQLKPFLKAENLHYADNRMPEKLFKWGLNPAIFIALNSTVEANGYWNRLKFRINEIRFSLLQRY